MPGTAGTQALLAGLQARAHSGTAHADWPFFLEEGQKHLAAGRLPDAKVFLEHTEFLAGADEPAVKGALAVLSLRQNEANVRAKDERYDALLAIAERYERDGHLLEATCALTEANRLKPSAALALRIEHLQD